MRHLTRSGMAILRCFILSAALLTTGALVQAPAGAPNPEYLLSPDNSLPTDSPYSKPTYVVGGDSSYPPYEYLENGQPQGFNVELIQAVGEVMGFDVTIRLGPWSEVRQQLENGEIDIISGMYYSPERDQRVDFSTPHTLVSSGLFVRSGSPIHNLEDIRGKAVIVQRGDFMHDYLLSEKLTDNIIAVDDSAQALNLLSSGKYDCALLSSKVQGTYLMSSLGLTNLNALETRLPQEEYAFAVTEGNSQLLYQLNEGLSILKNNGRYKQIYDKWFGVYEQSMLEKSLKYIGLFVGVLILLLLISALWSWSLRDQVKRQTKQLQKSEERFRSLYEQAPIAFQSLNDKGEILEVNPVWLQMMGYSRGEVINHSFEEFMTPEYSELFRQHYARLHAGDMLKGVEYELVRKDRSLFTALLDTKIIQLENEENPSILCTLQDISERKEAERALRISEEKFFKAFYTSPDAININRLEDGLYIEINEGFIALTGYTRAEVVGRTSLELNIWVNPEDRARLVRELKEDGEVTNLEAEFRTKDGTVITGLMSARLIEVNQETCILSITRDITELRQAMNHIENLARFPNENPYPVLRITSSGSILFYNKSSLPLIQMWGAEESRQAPKLWQNRVSHALSSKRRQEYEEFVGETTYLLALAPIPEAGYVNIYGTDVTEKKNAHDQVQRQLRYLRALRIIDLSITTSFDLPKTLTILLQQIQEHLDIDAADILLLNSNNMHLEHAASLGFHTDLLQRTDLLIGQGYAGRSVLEKKTLHLTREEIHEEHIFSAEQIEKEKINEYLCFPLISKEKVKGVLEIFQRSSLQLNAEKLEFLEAMTGQAAIAVDNATLFHDLQQANVELTSAYDATIEGWAKALELRDGETQGHSKRVVETTVELARQIGIDPDELVSIRRGALLHDIGKMGLPDSILLKPGPLTKKEWEVMRMHPIYAYQLLSSVEFLRPALDIPYCHHERWDGSGYPRHLKGTEIPLAARIFTVVDVWDALRSDRPYRKAWSDEAALQYLREQAGKLFDPEIVAVFLKNL